MVRKIISSHKVDAPSPSKRLSEYCIGIFAVLPSRKSIKKAIKNNRILLNGKIGYTGDWVKTGDRIQVLAPEKSTEKIYEMSFPVVFEDNFIAIINKPAGEVVSGNQFRTISNMLLHNIKLSPQEDALANPVAVHRLDAPTAGLLIIAKTALAQLRLGEQFANRSIKKTYQAIVCGQTPEKGAIALPIDQKAAYTLFQKIDEKPSIKNGTLSLLSLNPRTGRTHQLRKHLAYIGHPIMGDVQYGDPERIYKGKGLFLAAIRLQFKHPITEEDLDVQIDAPNKFALLLERESRMWRKKNGYAN